MDLPTLDFAQFKSNVPEEREELAKALAQSFKDHGFVKLINHGLPEDLVADMLASSNKFFSLSAEEKSQIANVPGPHPQRGWSCVGAEQTSKLRKENLGNSDGNDLTDAREHFDAGPLGDSQYPNKWPSDASVPGFQSLIETSYEICQIKCLEIMSALEIGLGLQPRKLVDRCIPAASELRMNHYPSIDTNVLKPGKVKRTWPHTDFGIITLLFQDSVGGLELEDRKRPGTFVPVTPNQPGAPSEMVVNISDTFHRWTNGVVPAGVHQVAPPAAAANSEATMLPNRHSWVFFFKASRDTSAGPLPDFISKDRPAQYDEITALQFQQRMTQKLY